MCKQIYITRSAEWGVLTTENKKEFQHLGTATLATILFDTVTRSLTQARDV